MREVRRVGYRRVTVILNPNPTWTVAYWRRRPRPLYIPWRGPRVGPWLFLKQPQPRVGLGVGRA